MESDTTIRKMLQGNQIFVPDYQRAYSWDTPDGYIIKNCHTNVFLEDLDAHVRSKAESPYYFGHFLFNDKSNGFFAVIDGQQRLTTIVILVCAIYCITKGRRDLSGDEVELFEDMVRRNHKDRFATVGYDNRLFIDYVIENSRMNTRILETESAKRIVAAFDFFIRTLREKDGVYLTELLRVVSGAACTTHIVKREADAVQMFIFQNNRGKRPSFLEILKAKFMFAAHLYGGDRRDVVLKEVKDRFESIYKSISHIEGRVDEDVVLTNTLRVYYDTLDESGAPEKIDKALSSNETTLVFVESFIKALSKSFESLETFFMRDEPKVHAIHSLVSLGGISIALPFIIKSYSFGLDTEAIGRMCSSLECVILRHRIIGSRADLATRLNEEFKAFSAVNRSIEPLLAKVSRMKTTEEWWLRHWNNAALQNALLGYIHRPVARYVLWKYENHLESLGKNGYARFRYDDISSAELEHIAPATEPSVKPHGYGEYDDDFRRNYFDCLGNYLLLSKSHNCSVGNIPFDEKLKSYDTLAHHREVKQLASKSGMWDKATIQFRRDKIVGFIMSEL